jgi:hypothetical protein
MPWVEFEYTIAELERAKTVHALDRAATVIGILPSKGIKYNIVKRKLFPVLNYAMKAYGGVDMT